MKSIILSQGERIILMLDKKPLATTLGIAKFNQELNCYSYTITNQPVPRMSTPNLIQQYEVFEPQNDFVSTDGILEYLTKGGSILSQHGYEIIADPDINSLKMTRTDGKATRPKLSFLAFWMYRKNINPYLLAMEKFQ